MATRAQRITLLVVLIVIAEAVLALQLVQGNLKDEVHDLRRAIRVVCLDVKTLHGGHAHAVKCQR